MSDEPKKPEQRPEESGPAPAPWERQPPAKPAGGLKHQLQGGDEVEYGADEGQQADYLADDQQSLHSRLAGGGRDMGAEADTEESRLCPGCGAITKFVQGKCSNCGHKLGSKPVIPPDAGVPAYGLPTPGTGSPLARNIVIVVLIIAILAVIVYFVLNSGGADGEEAPATTTSGTGVSTSAGHAGILNAVEIDDYFHDDTALALEAGSLAWSDAGIDCFVYRYRVFEQTVAAQSQTLRITAFVGGEDASASIVSPGDEPFRSSVAAFVDKLNSRSGVDASIFLLIAEDNETPAPGDVYVRYGYNYGLEHWAEVEPIILALQSIRNSEGQYPLSLTESIVRPKIRTYGGLNFLSNGYGYVPVFETDSSGKVIMGRGSGLAAYKPDNCHSYYLFKYDKAENMGLDVYGQDGIIYYREKISPFPYQPKSPITNVPLEPDGKPDGIACVVKDGKLLRN